VSLEAFISTPEQAERLTVFGNPFAVALTGARTGGVVSAVEGTFDPQGFAPLPHVHRAEDELFYVAEGSFDFLLGEEHVAGPAGSFVFVPRGTVHGFKATGDEAGRLVFLHLPALDGFFRELAQLAEPAPSQLRDLMTRWGMDVP
jgi:quercetin dioxygenase-like cupin family protein